MSIRAKILIACLTITAVTLAFGAVTRSAQSQLGEIAVKLYDEAFMSMSYLRSAQNTTLTIISRIAALGAEPADLAERFNDAVSDLDIARERALSPQGKRAASWLHDRLADVGHEFEATHHLPDRAALQELERRFDVAVEINAGDGFNSRRATTELVDRLNLQTWLAMGLSVAVALTITLVLSHMIVPGVRDAVSIAAAIAAGRLDNDIVAKGRSEIATLLRALSAMQRSIADKIFRIEQLMAKQADTHASELASQHVRFETALDNMGQGLCMFDESGRVLVHNRRFAEMFTHAGPGTAAEAVLPPLLLPKQDQSAGWTQSRGFTATLDDERSIAVMEQPMQGGGWVATYEDVTERYRIEARMAFMARHDALTGLPNRLLFREHMQHALAQARRGRGLSVLCLDLDHFKDVNDALGHSVGDGLLHAVAQVLLNETRETDMVVRLGGDEFAIVQSSATQPGDAVALAERLVALLGRPFQVGGHQVNIGVSIGIATTTDGLTTDETLLRSADLALYRAKADGRCQYRFFEPEMDATMQIRRTLEIDLRKAVAERQFENYYQPLLTADTREVSGFEALVRWRHPTKGMMSPSEFLTVAEETGIIAQIGSIVLERACFDALQWPASVKVAVNLSPLQFRNRALASEVAAALERSGLPPARLELEITESLLLQDSESTLAILNEIRALGVHISMDDFGTGYSSLSYLRRFPFDKIKIDQSFIRHLEDSGDCIAIVRAVLGLGKSLGMRVVAEGVETEEQFSLLRREGCEQVQGYLFSKPVPLHAAESLTRPPKLLELSPCPN
ncbi:MAG: EAL domain-containing protein [Acetobacteraceae bacterium]|nr:EAL domain-containing protein [Acetobacteraceae bacterium]